MRKVVFNLKNLKIFIFLFFIFSIIVNSKSEIRFSPDKAALNGYVKDSLTGETVVGATISIIGTKNGGYTNKSGYYSIQDLTPGKYKVRVSMVSYKQFEQLIDFKMGDAIRKDFIIIPSQVTTNEVNVEADRDIETREISISKVNIPIAQIKEIRIGGESDVFRSIQMLPGVLTSSQISSGLYIRGGSPDQNLILLDGATVYNPTHLFGFISTFNSDAIKDVELIKGGYPAEYGSRLSSVLNITQKDGNRNNFGGVASVGLISSKLSLEGPSPVGKGSWFAGGRTTYFDLIKGAIDNDPKTPLPDFGFYDINGKLTQEVGQNDKFSLSGFLSRDNFNYVNAGLDLNLFMGNKCGSFKWTHIFGDKFFTNVIISGSKYNNGMITSLSGYNIKIENNIFDYTLKANSDWFASDNLTINTGFEMTNYSFEYIRNFSGDDKSSNEGTNQGSRVNLMYHDWLYNAFIQGNQKIGDLMSVQAGFRGSYWTDAGKFLIDPRLAYRWQIQENFAVKASVGMFHQYLRLAGDPNFSLFDTWLQTDKSVEPSEAIHYILSFETSPVEDYDLNFDLYYKTLSNISEVKLTATEGSQVKDFFYNGKGRAYGGEIFLQKKVGKFAGWMGYALGWVEAVFDSINSGKKFRPKYDRRHDFKIVVQYQFNDHWSFGATFMFQTGQSYTAATSRFEAEMPGTYPGEGKVIPSDKYALRMPPSHQLNVNANYLTKMFGNPLKISLDIYNVYNRRDILMRTYNTNNDVTSIEDVKLLPIIPTFSIEYKF